MSAALRTVSFLAVDCALRLAKRASDNGRPSRTKANGKNFLWRNMASPFAGKSYNKASSLRQEQYHPGSVVRESAEEPGRDARAGQGSLGAGSVVVMYAVHDHFRRDTDARPPKLHARVLGTRIDGNASAGSAVGGSAGQDGDHERDDRQRGGDRGREDSGRIQADDARKPERPREGIRGDFRAAHAEFRRAFAAVRSGFARDEAGERTEADEDFGGAGGCGVGRAEESGGRGVLERARTCGAGANEESFLGGVDGDVPGEAEAL